MGGLFQNAQKAHVRALSTEPSLLLQLVKLHLQFTLGLAAKCGGWGSYEYHLIYHWWY